MFKIQGAYSFPSCCLMFGYRIKNIITKPQIEEVPDNRTEHALEHALLYRVHALEEIEQQVLSWGTHATVIGPEELRERLRRTIEDMLPKYAING